MPSPFHNSIFHYILESKDNYAPLPIAIMGGISGSRFNDKDKIEELPFVFFDFETTGLDVRTCRIIEMGAVKYIGRREVARFSSLVHPGVSIPKEITEITGIDDATVAHAPTIEKILPEFHDFLRGCAGVAHNAEFDVGMLFHESVRIGISCDYTIFCSLKMARNLVKIDRRNLDSLAAHYGLTFESRHRSIGDILVTAGVFWHMIDDHPGLLVNIRDLAPYQEFMPQ